MLRDSDPTGDLSCQAHRCTGFMSSIRFATYSMSLRFVSVCFIGLQAPTSVSRERYVCWRTHPQVDTSASPSKRGLRQGLDRQTHGISGRRDDVHGGTQTPFRLGLGPSCQGRRHSLR